MKELALKVETVSKQYRLGVVGSGTLGDDIKRSVAKWRGKGDPTLEIGVENKIATAGGNSVWALRDISFEVEKGEVLGIIGKNGAGKSTLLKILSKVTAPTEGKIFINGKVASLLEVGTGFHPELTGRENIFLNGAILGMKRKEIKSKLDDIISFSGVEKYIDTPVKRYSSGMQVRLAFSVAAFLEPEILIIDEVLAVGDIEFQKRALGKMESVTRNEGRTVLFVSHNMNAVRQLTSKSLLLVNGRISSLDDTNVIVDRYQSDFINANFFANNIETLNKDFQIKSFSFLREQMKFGFNQPIPFQICLEVKERSFKDLNFILGISNSIGSRILTSRFLIKELGKGIQIVTVSISDHHLTPGEYTVSFGISQYEMVICSHEDLISLPISDKGVAEPLLLPHLSKGRDKIGSFLSAEYVISAE